MSNHVINIVKKFGGLTKMSEAIGYPLTTVQAWQDRGAIHDKHKPIIQARAEAIGIMLTPADFFPEGSPSADR